ncbi:hypothetical protein FRX31_024460 [Thalictrum thalictroides]|uniref:Uncharacterized protein n=1 Tax=Thalictrum thalictroides TaxID=46969 RepID=A0A7J6VP76_THATH|nr:hypothetical protein FRX31_024460 [Thalictrum thalictroides]
MNNLRWGYGINRPHALRMNETVTRLSYITVFNSLNEEGKGRGPICEGHTVCCTFHLKREDQ